SYLPRILFPVGGLLKCQVRQIAKERLNLHRINAKKSSRGICMIGKRKFADFIDSYLDKNRGKLIDIDSGECVGEHDGLHRYTVGQRVAVSDECNPRKKRFFVAEKNTQTNEIFVVHELMNKKKK